jgi:hypothetical protein
MRSLEKLAIRSIVVIERLVFLDGESKSCVLGFDGRRIALNNLTGNNVFWDGKR